MKKIKQYDTLRIKNYFVKLNPRLSQRFKIKFKYLNG